MSLSVCFQVPNITKLPKKKVQRTFLWHLEQGNHDMLENQQTTPANQQEQRVSKNAPLHKTKYPQWKLPTSPLSPSITNKQIIDMKNTEWTNISTIYKMLNKSIFNALFNNFNS